MSYNIDTWNTKKLENLIIPLSEIKKLEYVETHLDENGSFIADGVTEWFEISGILKEKNVHVEKIELCSEGSGYIWDAFKSMLEKSTGTLTASQVWEGGDSITRIHVKDGNVVEEQVEI